MIPKAFMQRMTNMPGLDFPAFAAALEGAPVRALRVGTAKTDAATLQALLPFPLTPIPFDPNAYYLTASRVGGHPAHHAGMFYMQDPSAIAAVAAARPAVGSRVIDLCAAPGGKTVALSSAIGETGVLVSNEYVSARCRILQGNVERMGLTNTVVTNLDTGELADIYGSYFDLVVADAPCSGEGMFRKYEAAGAEWSPENVQLCAARQKMILENAARLTAPGGRLLYSTCTFSMEENEENIGAFLTAHPEFRLIPADAAVVCATAAGVPPKNPPKGADFSLCRRFYPHLSPGEGQFLALMQKAGDAPRVPPQKQKRETLSPAVLREVTRYTAEFCPLATENLIPLRENISAAPDLPLPPRGVFAAGVTLGALQRSHFLPHHHFYSAFGRKFTRKLNLREGDPRVQEYLAGAEIEGAELAHLPNGFAAILYENAPLGGGKAVSGRLKNHYPKGLRQKGEPVYSEEDISC